MSSPPVQLGEGTERGGYFLDAGAGVTAAGALRAEAIAATTASIVSSLFNLPAAAASSSLACAAQNPPTAARASPAFPYDSASCPSVVAYTTRSVAESLTHTVLLSIAPHRRSIFARRFFSTSRRASPKPVSWLSR